MADQKGRWSSARQIWCCFTSEDTGPDPQEQQLQQQHQYSSSASDDSEPEILPDPPHGTPEGSSVFDMTDREYSELMYKRRIHELEEELAEAIKNRKELSLHLCEMGSMVFPEMEPCDSISPYFVEKLKVYLECLQLERKQLEKRAVWAEQTLCETQNNVDDLERILQGFGYRGPRRMRPLSAPDELPPLPSLPLRCFFPKIQKKSPESKVAAPGLGKWPEESFGEVSHRKRSPVKDMLTMCSWSSSSKQGSPEPKVRVPLVKRDIFPEHTLPQIVPHLAAGSTFWPLFDLPQCSAAKASAGFSETSETCVAQVHGHWETIPEREQEGLTRCVEDNHLSRTSTLRAAIPSAAGSEDISAPPDSSVRLQKSKMEDCNVQSEKQHLASMEGNCEIERQRERSTSQEGEYVTLRYISPKPEDSVGQVFEYLHDAPTDNPKAETFQDLSGHATLQTEVTFPGKDSSKPGQSQSSNIVHSSEQTADLEPEQASCRLELLQKPGKELPSSELSLKTDLPSSSIKALEAHKPLEEKKVLEDASGLNNKTDQPLPKEENATAACPSHLDPKELLPSDLYGTLTSVSLESSQPASLKEESPSGLAEEVAVDEKVVPQLGD
ncbi:uncharacterized protein LOC143821901 [Paroedura picta]|uniref:uncharacterized protein LOC143821901 n=1 Tax=Paroedura picta TaxID=143630 RepID=UPI004055A695